MVCAVCATLQRVWYALRKVREYKKLANQDVESQRVTVALCLAQLLSRPLVGWGPLLVDSHRSLNLSQYPLAPLLLAWWAEMAELALHTALATFKPPGESAWFALPEAMFC